MNGDSLNRSTLDDAVSEAELISDIKTSNFFADFTTFLTAGASAGLAVYLESKHPGLDMKECAAIGTGLFIWANLPPINPIIAMGYTESFSKYNKLSEGGKKKVGIPYPMKSFYRGAKAVAGSTYKASKFMYDTFSKPENYLKFGKGVKERWGEFNTVDKIKVAGLSLYVAAAGSYLAYEIIDNFLK